MSVWCNQMSIGQAETCCRMGMNCLANVVHAHYDPILVEYHLRTPPGQLFNIDQQCQYIHNSASSFYCGVKLPVSVLFLRTNWSIGPKFKYSCMQVVPGCLFPIALLSPVTSGLSETFPGTWWNEMSVWTGGFRSESDKQTAEKLSFFLSWKKKESA